jgi:hypothetical protein
VTSTPLAIARRPAAAGGRPRSGHSRRRARGHLRGLRAEQPHQGRLGRHGPGPGHQPHSGAGPRRPDQRTQPRRRHRGWR